MRKWWSVIGYVWCGLLCNIQEAFVEIIFSNCVNYSSSYSGCSLPNYILLFNKYSLLNIFYLKYADLLNHAKKWHPWLVIAEVYHQLLLFCCFVVVDCYHCCCFCSCCSCWSKKPPFKVWDIADVAGGGGRWWRKVIFVSNPTFELSCGWVGGVTKYGTILVTYARERSPIRICNTC